MDGFPGSSLIKNLPAKAGRRGFDPWVRRSPGEEKWQANILAGKKSREQRSLVVTESWTRLSNLTRDLAISSVQSLSRVRLFATPRTAAHQASLSITYSWSLLRLMSIESVMPSNHLILCHPLLLPSIFPSTRVFSSESVLCIRWPKYWSFSFSISLTNEYSGLISFRMDLLAVQGDSRESSPTPQFKSINSSVLSFLYSATFISIRDYWKNHNFDYTDVCWESNVSAF